MARKRAADAHNVLPKYVYIRRGWYIYRPHLGQGHLGKDVKLCPETALISEVWRRYESLTCTDAPRKTMQWLFEQYLASPQHAGKSVKTRKEYEKNAKKLSTTPTKNGTLFGQLDAERITPGVVRKYMDSREQKVSANREKAFMSVCFSWAVERDLLKTNPCKSVRSNTEKPRDRYVTEEEFNLVYALAAKYPHIQCAMELAYLCRMRTCEVLDLKKSDITEKGLLIRRRKGSRDNITIWSTRLERVIQKCETLPKPNADIANYYLIRGQKGDRLTESGLQTLWGREIMPRAVEKGMARFTFHDLKAGGISDTIGNKQEASGHRTAAMVDRYDRKLAEVKPAGNE